MQQNFFGIAGVYKDQAIQGGQPVVETGIPIYVILDMLAQGFTQEVMREEYGVTVDHIQTAFHFASTFIKREWNQADGEKP